MYCRPLKPGEDPEGRSFMIIKRSIVLYPWRKSETLAKSKIPSMRRLVLEETRGKPVRESVTPWGEVQTASSLIGEPLTYGSDVTLSKTSWLIFLIFRQPAGPNAYFTEKLAAGWRPTFDARLY